MKYVGCFSRVSTLESRVGYIRTDSDLNDQVNNTKIKKSVKKSRNKIIIFFTLSDYICTRIVHLLNNIHPKKDEKNIAIVLLI